MQAMNSPASLAKGIKEVRSPGRTKERQQGAGWYTRHQAAKGDKGGMRCNSPASPERRGGGKGAGWYTRLQAAEGIKEVRSPGRTKERKGAEEDSATSRTITLRMTKAINH